MAELISNSGTTFIAAGGTVGVQVSTNTNWRFYLTGRTGVPDWLHFNGNVSEITGSESKMVTVEATKNTQTTTRSASGICQSISEPTLTAWTGFWQGAGGGEEDEGVKITLVLHLRASGSNKMLQGLTVEIPQNNSIVGDWGYYGTWPCDWWNIPLYTNTTTTVYVELKKNTTQTYTEKMAEDTYRIHSIGGDDSRIMPGTYSCSLGVRTNIGGSGSKHQTATGTNRLAITDQGGGNFTLVSTTITGGQYWAI